MGPIEFIGIVFLLIVLELIQSFFGSTIMYFILIAVGIIFLISDKNVLKDGGKEK